MKFTVYAIDTTSGEPKRGREFYSVEYVDGELKATGDYDAFSPGFDPEDVDEANREPAFYYLLALAGQTYLEVEAEGAKKDYSYPEGFRLGNLFKSIGEDGDYEDEEESEEEPNEKPAPPKVPARLTSK